MLDHGVWQIEPWMPGTPITGKQVTGRHLESAFQTLTTFHDMAIRGAAAIKTRRMVLPCTETITRNSKKMSDRE